MRPAGGLAHNESVALVLLLFGTPFAALVGGSLAMLFVAAWSGVPMSAADGFGTAMYGVGAGVALALLLRGAVESYAESARGVLARIELGLGLLCASAGLAGGAHFVFTHEWANGAELHAAALRRCGEAPRALVPMSRPSGCVRGELRRGR